MTSFDVMRKGKVFKETFFAERALYFFPSRIMVLLVLVQAAISDKRFLTYLTTKPFVSCVNFFMHFFQIMCFEHFPTVRTLQQRQRPLFPVHLQDMSEHPFEFLLTVRTLVGLL